MKKSGTVSPRTPSHKGRPALSVEARESQMISYTMDLVEERILNGTASSQETTHFLKLGSTKAAAEKRLLEMQIELAQVKADSIRREEHREELFKEAIEAMKMYSGNGKREENDQDVY